MELSKLFPLGCGGISVNWKMEDGQFSYAFDPNHLIH